VLAILLGIVVIPLSCLATFQLMQNILGNVGRPKAATVAKAPDMHIVEEIDTAVSARMEAVRGTMIPGNLPEGAQPEAVPQETLPPVRKQYWIEEGTLVAPEPNQNLFGRTSDREELTRVLEEARWILEGQKTYFQPDQKLYEDSIVRYYLDDSIFAITWQEVHDGSIYTFSEVKVSHPSQFRRHLAGGEYGSDMQYLTTEMAAEVNAVVASAGDFYRFRDFGAVVYQGQAKRVEGTYAETCYIDANGDMHFTYGGDVLKVADVQAFVDEHDIQFSLAFGPILVDNYEVIPHTWYGVGEINEEYARAALLQMDTLHYIVVTANTDGVTTFIPTVAKFQEVVAATGCRHAYSLDGGQTATIVMRNELINSVDYGDQRDISDIIYFATALPEVE
jgi:exopolysaccharide biosynthesis protein